MSERLNALKATLLSRLQGTQNDPSHSDPIKADVDLLVGAVREFELGDYTLGELKEVFAENPVPNFSIESWVGDSYGTDTET